MSGPQPMNGGDGKFSYAKNSSFQRGATNYVKGMMDEAIAQNLDVKQLLSTTSLFKVADVGCSVGPNTFVSMEHVIEAVKLKCYTQGGLTCEITEFQVFFSDLTLNDFNTLFQSLPPQRQYFATGVPGSFHGRLFPKSSLHFVHSSYALQYLSQVPKEVMDKSSPAWNKGRISCFGASEEVEKAYASQFATDMEVFLNARAQELVVGGLMVIVLPIIRSGIPSSESSQCLVNELLCSILQDMAKEGLVSEDQVDSFNFPVFLATPEKWEELIERNGSFKIEKNEVTSVESISNAPISSRISTTDLRAVAEGTMAKHFGHQVMDVVFDRFCKKMEAASSRFQSSFKKSAQLFLALKRI